MDRYLDIRIRPDPEFSEPMLMNALFSKLHRALVSLESDDIGISFPGQKITPRTLGECLRVHGTEQRLGALMETCWLKGMADHITCSGLLIVPNNTQFCVVRRRQVKSNVERLRRRRMKRKGDSYEQCSEIIPDSVEKCCELPFVSLRSQSTGEAFKLFVEHGQLQSHPAKGTFNSYGLSLSATIPWFSEP